MSTTNDNPPVSACPFCGMAVSSPIHNNPSWVWHEPHAWCPLSGRGFTTNARWWNQRAEGIVNEQLARQIAAVLATAHGECYVCAEALAEEMRKMFPQFDWVLLVQQSKEETYARFRNEIRSGGGTKP